MESIFSHVSGSERIYQFSKKGTGKKVYSPYGGGNSEAKVHCSIAGFYFPYDGGNSALDKHADGRWSIPRMTGVIPCFLTECHCFPLFPV